MPKLASSIFISYASEDSELVCRLAVALRELGLEPRLYDEHLPAGDSIVGWIDTELTECPFALIIASSHYFGKQWTVLEYRAIVHSHVTRGKDSLVLVATVKEDVKLPPLLRTFRHISLAAPTAAAQEIRQALLGSQAGTVESDISIRESLSPPADVRDERLIACLSERELLLLATLLCNDWYESRRAAKGRLITMRMPLGRREAELQIPAVAFDDEILRLELVGQVELAKINFQFMSKLQAMLDRGGLGIMTPAFELEFDRKREAYVAAVNSLRAALAEMADTARFL